MNPHPSPGDAGLTQAIWADGIRRRPFFVRERRLWRTVSNSIGRSTLLPQRIWEIAAASQTESQYLSTARAVARCPVFNPQTEKENDHETPNELLSGRTRYHQSTQPLEAQVQGSGLEQSLIELVKTRTSQINGCAFRINMHTQDARKHGENEQRLYLLNAWRESRVYTDRERAALAWTESVTLISQTHAPDDVYDDVRAQFSEAETVNLTMLIATINAWNRLAISFRSVHPVKAKAAVA